MASFIGRLSIAMGVDTAGLSTDFRRAERIAERRSREIQRKMRAAGAVVGGALAAGAVIAVRSLNSVAEEADKVAKASRNMGIGAEALQELRGAGELSGLAIRDVDDALRRFNRRLGLFITDGSGPAAKSIEQLGLELFNAQGQFIGTERALDQAIDAIADLPTVAEQAAAASQLFGDDAGPKLVTLLSQGSDGVQDLREQIRATGSVMSDEAVQAAERYQDATLLLGKQFSSLTVQLGSRFLPVAADLVESFNDMLLGASGADRETENFNSTVVLVGRSIEPAVQWTARFVAGLISIGRFAGATVQSLNTLATRFGDFADLSKGFDQFSEGNFVDGLFGEGAGDFFFGDGLNNALIEGNFSEIGTRLLGLRKQTEEESEAMGDAVSELADVWDNAFADVLAIFEQADSFTSGFSERTRRQGKSWVDVVREMAKEGQKAAQEIDASNARSAEVAAEWVRKLEDIEARLSGPVAEAALQFNRRQAEVAQALDEGQISLDQYNRLVSAYAEEVRRALDPSEELAEAIREQAEAQQAAEDSYQGVKTSLEDQIALLTLTGDELYAYERALFQAAAVNELAEGATQAHREEIARLAGEFFDTANAAESFAERVADALNNVLPAGLAEGIGRGLEEGLSRGIASIDTQDVLDGNFSEIGQTLGQSLTESLGRSIGTYFGGPIGGEIGSLIGDIIGDAIFGGSVPKFQVFGSQGQMDLGTDLTLDGPLGELNFGFREIEAEAQTAVRNAFVQFDTTIAGFIRDTDQLTQIDQALQQFGVSSRRDGESIEGLLQLRFDAILSSFDSVTQDVVRAAGQTLEAQVQALADIQAIAVQESLGRGLGLDNALSVIAELQIPGEALSATFSRLRDAAALLDTTMALTGATFGSTRAEVLRFGQGLSDAFGGDLQRASDLLGTIFGTFFTETERLEVQVEQSTSRAVDLLAQLGIDATDELLSRGGFRELFDALADTLSPADLAVLIEAGAEIAALIQAEESLAEIRSDSVGATNEATGATEDLSAALEEAAQRERDLAQLLVDVGLEALQVVAPARAEFAELVSSIQDNITRARELGATESQLNLIRQASEIRIRGFIASLSESIASLTEQLFGTGPQIDALGGTLNLAASAAGNFRDQWLRAIDNIQAALDDQLLGPNSTLTAAERQSESLRQFNEALAAAQAGDLSAAQSLPQLFQQALSQGASFFGSTSSEFGALEAQLRAALETADLPVPPDSPEVQTAQNTFSAAQGIQQVEQTALQQLTAATQLIDQIGLLADLTGQTPAEIGAEFGIPIGRLIEILTGEAADANADSLDSQFNDLAESIGQDLNELAALENISNLQLAELRNITELLGGVDITKPLPDLSKPAGFASGGLAGKSGIEQITVGEQGPEAVFPASVTSFFQRVGIPVNATGGSEARLANIEALLSTGINQREVLIGDQRQGLTAVVSSSRQLRDELRKRPSTGKAALTRA